MKVHAPEGYDCPFCRLVDAAETGCNGRADVVWVDAETTAFVSPKW